MKDLRTLLRRAGARIILTRFIQTLVPATSLAVGALTLVLIAHKLTAFDVNWWALWLAALAAAIGASAAWALLHRPTSLHVAQAVDERANLHETLSTALCVHNRRDSWSRAALEDAADCSRRVIIRRALPFSLPHRWQAPPIAAAVFTLILWLAPQGDLLGYLARDRAEADAKQELIETTIEVAKNDETLDKALAKISDPSLNIPLDEAKPKPDSAKQVRRAAIKKLTRLNDRLDALRKAGAGLRVDAVRRQLQKLRQPGKGPLNALVAALQKGDLKLAGERFDELAGKLAQGNLSAADQEALAEQAKKLAEQFKKLASDQSDLERKLESLGLSKKLASDPDALKQAIEKLAGLTDEQKQQLLDQAQAIGQTGDQLNKLGDALSQAAQDLQEGAPGGQGMGQLGDMLGDLEMLAQEIDAVDAAQGEVGRQLAQLGQGLGGGGRHEFNMWELWEPQGNGSGQGSGAPRSSAKAAFNTNKVKAPSPNQQGPIIGVRIVQDGQVRGESRAQFTKIVDQGASAASQAIEDKAIPREYHDAVKRYFGRLKSRVEIEKANEQSPTAEPDEQPEEKPADSDQQDDAAGSQG